MPTAHKGRATCGTSRISSQARTTDWVGRHITLVLRFNPGSESWVVPGRLVASEMPTLHQLGRASDEPYAPNTHPN